MAAVLRAALGRVPRRAVVRGPALGRRRPTRLHRPHARMVGGAPHLHHRLRAARAHRAQGRLARGTARRATRLYLEPLSDVAVGHLLDGLVAGLPPDASERIVSQAEGVPLYALETVRALADRGVLASDNGGPLHPVGELGDLDVPATLSSLLAARLDGLDPDEREVVKAMAVF